MSSRTEITVVSYFEGRLPGGNSPRPPCPGPSRRRGPSRPVQAPRPVPARPGDSGSSWPGPAPARPGVSGTGQAMGGRGEGGGHSGSRASRFPTDSLTATGSQQCCALFAVRDFGSTTGTSFVAVTNATGRPFMGICYELITLRPGIRARGPGEPGPGDRGGSGPADRRARDREPGHRGTGDRGTGRTGGPGGRGRGPGDGPACGDAYPTSSSATSGHGWRWRTK